MNLDHTVFVTSTRKLKLKEKQMEKLKENIMEIISMLCLISTAGCVMSILITSTAKLCVYIWLAQVI
jgi:septum formation topological specificity factor MinE